MNRTFLGNYCTNLGSNVSIVVMCGDLILIIIYREYVLNQKSNFIKKYISVTVNNH